MSSITRLTGRESRTNTIGEQDVNCFTWSRIAGIIVARSCVSRVRSFVVAHARTAGSSDPKISAKFLHANYVECSHAPSNAAQDVVIEALVRQPFHRVFRRAIRRSRNPAGDHSE